VDLHWIATAGPAALAGVAAGILGGQLCSGVGWRAALSAAGAPLGLRATLSRYGTGSLVNALAPARLGDVVRLGLLVRAAGSRRPLVAVASAAALVAAARALVRLPFAASAGARSPLLAIGAGVALALAAGAAIRCRRLGRRGLPVLGWAAAAGLSRLGATTVLAAGFDRPRPLAAGLTAIAALDLAGAVQLTPANLGVTTAALTGALAAVGAPPGRALAAAATFDALQALCGLAFGSVCTASLVRGRPSSVLGRVRGVRELAELARDEVRRLLADVHRVVADPLDAARDDDHPQPPLVPALVAREAEHVADDAPVGAVDQLVEIDEPLRPGDVAREERLDRGADHLLGARAHLLEGVQERLVGREPLRQLRQLRDRHAVVGHPLEVEVHVQHREHVTEVDRHGRLPREQRVDPLLDAEEAAIDLVVEGDHLVGELDVLLLEGGDRPSERAQDEVALLL
jgi:uncharacterized membrane protein YbhN (UPF0104 family)